MNQEVDRLHSAKIMFQPCLLPPIIYLNKSGLLASQKISPVKKSAAQAPTQKLLEQQHSDRESSIVCDRKYGIPLHSSQESSFEGFNDSPFGRVHRQLYPGLVGPSNEIVQPNTGAIIFPRFYDIITAENSCNAVDVPLPDENHTSCSESHSSGDICNNGNANPSSELSFNGKIKELTINSAEPMPVEVTSAMEAICDDIPKVFEPFPQNSKTSESFVLKKYSNERSPDLFGEDDDDEDDEGDGGKKYIKSCVAEKDEVQVNNKVTTMDTKTVQSDAISTLHTSVNKFNSCPTEFSYDEEPTLDDSTKVTDSTQSSFRDNYQRDREMLRRIRKCLAGIPPPPSFTILQLDLFNSVLSRKEEILNFLSPISAGGSEAAQSCRNDEVFSLLRPTHSLDEVRNMSWNDLRNVRQHGLSYNLNKANESNEYLNLSVIERFVGAETASSYRNSPSSAKKRSTRLKLLTQSPGSRLSHLAKRRAIFSSAHLATTSLKSNSLMGPQIVVDKRTSKHRRKGTPKRKTPGSKRKNRKTPSSSARKRLFRNDIAKPGPSRESSKRALFQSPAKHQLLQKQIAAHKPSIKPELAVRVEKSKRALFSPDHQSESSQVSSLFSFSLNSEEDTHGRLDSLLKRKRNFDDDTDTDMDLTAQNCKLFRTSCDGNSSAALTPRALKIKSQSFCIGAGPSSSTSSSMTVTSANSIKNTATILRAPVSFSGSNLSLASSWDSSNINTSNALSCTAKMQRAYSDMAMPTNSLTENQRKKLLWAVSQALQEKKITAKHESFKQYASVLARVVRRIFQEFYQKGSTSNSETMLRLAKKYVYNVITGKNADDIYFQAKAQIEEAKRLSSTRISGYVAPEDYQQRQTAQLGRNRLGSCQNIFSMDSVDSFSMCLSNQTISTLGPASSNEVSISASQTSLFECATQGSNSTQSKNHLASQQQQEQQLPIQPNAGLRNSSSKNNLSGLALRENVDCEQRRSAQKNFTGKDQRNVSPYAAGRTSSSGAKTLLVTHSGESSAPSLAKAKRQITFDC